MPVDWISMLEHELDLGFVFEVVDDFEQVSDKTRQTCVCVFVCVFVYVCVCV